MMLSKKQYFLIIILAILLGVFTAIWQIPFWRTAVLIFLSVTLIIYVPFVWYMYFSTNTESTGEYLKRRTRQPIIQFYYSLANSETAQMEEALSLLKKKYKAPQMTAVFTVAYAAHQENLAAVKESIQLIKDVSARQYYEALLKIEEGQWEYAVEMIPVLQKSWMKEAVKADLLRKKGETETAELHESKAIDLTKGMQRYLLEKRYR
jgi:Ca2+/Na+ antiporter